MVLIFPLIAFTHRVIASRLCERAFKGGNRHRAVRRARRLTVFFFFFFFAALSLRHLKVLSHRERCVERCSNATNGKIRIMYILMVLSHCTRDAALRVLCECIVEIFKVLIFPLIALTHHVIARRLCYGPLLTTKA